jgi:tetratricopeptide (TPR) repeat protein
VGANDEALERLADAPPAEIFERSAAHGARMSPSRDDPSFVERATSVELFLESPRLLEAAASLPPSQRPEAARRALALVSEAVLRAPAARALYHVQRANAAIDAGDAAAARSEAEALLVLWPDSFREVYVAGSALLELDPARALPLLARAAELAPEHPGTLSNLGTVRVLLGDAEGAESAFRAALALDRYAARRPQRARSRPRRPRAARRGAGRVPSARSSCAR